MGRTYLLAAIRGWLLIRAGRTEDHRQWMIRSYALMLAAVSLRLQLPLAGIYGIAFVSSYPIIAWSCWVPNLIIAEWVIARRRAARGL